MSSPGFECRQVSPSPWKHEGWGQRWGRSWVPSSQRTTGCRRHGAASGTHGTKASLGPDYPHRLGLPLGWMLAAGDALGPGRSGHDRATGPEPEGCRLPHRSTARMPSGSAEPLLPAAPQPSWVPDRAPRQGRRHLQTWPFLSPSPALPTWGAQLRIPSTPRKRLHRHLFLSRLSSCRRPPHPRHRRTPGLGLCCPLRQGEGSVRAEGGPARRRAHGRLFTRHRHLFRSQADKTRASAGGFSRSRGRPPLGAGREQTRQASAMLYSGDAERTYCVQRHTTEIRRSTTHARVQWRR